MNIHINSLMIKLNWQLDTLQKQMRNIYEQISMHQQDMQTLTTRIEEACEVPLVIYPEQEMARLSFTLKQQNAWERLELLCNDQKTELKRMEEREMRLKTELKLLERHMTNQNEHERLQQAKKQSLQMDEWGLQRKQRE